MSRNSISCFQTFYENCRLHCCLLVRSLESNCDEGRLVNNSRGLSIWDYLNFLLFLFKFNSINEYCRDIWGKLLNLRTSSKQTKVVVEDAIFCACPSHQEMCFQYSFTSNVVYLCFNFILIIVKNYLIQKKF